MTEDPLVARRVTVLSIEYVARAFRGLAEIYGDGRAGLIVQAIVAANTAHLDPLGEEAPRVAGPDAVLPDEVRKPVSITRLASSLGMPFETTRRQVRRLINAGVCVNVDGGLVVTAAAMQRPEVVQAVMTNLESVRKLVRDLQAVGLDVEEATPPGEP